MKKIFSFLFLMLAILTFVGCGENPDPKPNPDENNPGGETNKSEENIKGDLIELLNKLYEGIEFEGLEKIILPDDMMHLFTNLLKDEKAIEKINYEEIAISMPSFSNTSHAVVLIRLQDKSTEKEINDVVALLNENVNLRWQECVQAETSVVESKGNLVLFATVSENISLSLKENFSKLESIESANPDDNKPSDEINDNTNITGDLLALLESLYSGVSADNLPWLEQAEVTEDMIYLFTNLLKDASVAEKINYKEIAISMSAMGSIPHAVVLIRLQDNATEKEISDAVTLLKDNARPRWQVCTEAESVVVESKGNLILFAMVDIEDPEDDPSFKLAPVLKENFSKLESITENEEENNEENLLALLESLYSGVSADNLPWLEQAEVTEDMIYLFTNLLKDASVAEKINYKEIAISMPAMGSIPHAVVLIRLQDNATEKEISDAVTLLKDNAKPRWQVCVEAESVVVESKGNLILFAMVDIEDPEDAPSFKLAPVLKENFSKLESTTPSNPDSNNQGVVIGGLE